MMAKEANDWNSVKVHTYIQYQRDNNTEHIYVPKKKRK